MAARIITEVLRAAGRLPVPGTFPLLVDPVHRLVDQNPRMRKAKVCGATIDLNLEDYVERRIYYANYEPELVRFLGRILRPGDHVVDIGANIGFLSMVAA